MHLFFFHHQAKHQEDDQNKHAVVVDEHPHNTNEGSEFLDDAIRIKEQPLMYTEETIAAASPGNPEVK